MKARRKQSKFTGSAKITLATLSVATFIGGWNLIARVESKDAQASEPAPVPLPPTPFPASNLSAPIPTSWPTIPPLATLPPIPTLVPTFTSQQPASVAQLENQTGGPAANVELAPVQIAPLPTLIPLPTLAPLPSIPAPPPPPPPVPVWNGSNSSGGS